MKDLLPKVSVMIITYNQIGYIRECLESVVSQDYENLEVIVSDDASTDGTQNVILEFANSYPQIIRPLLGESNIGVTGNSNRAFRACTGEFIALLGGDDIFGPGKIRVQSAFMRRNPECKLSYHACYSFDDETKEIICKDAECGPLLMDWSKLYSYGNDCHRAVTMMLRRSSCPENGFDRRVPVLSDIIFFLETSYRSNIYRVPGIYTLKRSHSCNVTKAIQYEEIFDLLSQIEQEKREFLVWARKYKYWPLYLIYRGRQIQAVYYFLRMALSSPRNRENWFHVYLAIFHSHNFFKKRQELHRKWVLMKRHLHSYRSVLGI